MSRELWLGPILNSNRTRLIARCRQLVLEGRGHEFVYLAATKPLMDKVAFELMRGEVSGSIRPLNVFLLSGFSRRIVADARFEGSNELLPYFPAIDSEQRPVLRPLFRRILSRLYESEAIPSLGSLARTDGVAASIATLVAEIQRAGTTASEFGSVVKRRMDLERESKPTRESSESKSQPGDAANDDASALLEVDDPLTSSYDLDTALIYEHYEQILEANNLTDASRDYLRALAVLRGEFRGRPVRTLLVENARLLIIDGFFDLLPIHAEILSILVRRMPETIVNLNHDRTNPSAFRAFEDVIERFGERSGFQERYDPEIVPLPASLEILRIGLFNTNPRGPEREAPSEAADRAVDGESPAITIIEAPDRIHEVREVAKRIKELVLLEGYSPHEIAVVYKNRNAYEALVREVFRSEAIAISLGERRPLTDLPSARAAMKLLDAALSNSSRRGLKIRVDKIVALLKSDYFRLRVEAESGEPQPPLPFDGQPVLDEKGPGADELENAAAFIGAELRLDDWLARAAKIIKRFAIPDHLNRFSSLLEAADDSAGDDGEADDRPGAERQRLSIPLGLLRRACGYFEAIGKILRSIPHESRVEETAARFLDALKSLDFENQLLEYARSAELDETSLRRAALDLRGYEGLENAVRAVVDASRLAATIESPRRQSDDTTVTLAEFRSDLQKAMETQEMLIESERDGGVRVLGVTDMRGMGFRIVFLLGLVEGEFPERARTDWIYPQAERDTMRDLGLPLEDISPEESLGKEEHYFYQAACRATSHLYLSRPVSTDDEDETVESYFVRELVRLLPSDSVSYARAATGFNGENLLRSTTEGELARSVVRCEANLSGNQAPATVGVLSELSSYVREDRAHAGPILSRNAVDRLGVEEIRSNRYYGEYDGLIGDARLHAMLDERYGLHVFSASELNEYGNCPFRFFMKRVLDITQRVEAALDLGAFDIGILLHEVMRRFFEEYRGKSLVGIPEAELVGTLERVSNDVFQRFEASMPPLNPKLWQIEKQTLSILLRRTLADELEFENKAAGPMVPRYFEFAFGMPAADSDPASSPLPLVVRRDLDDGTVETLSLRGQIDRIDVSIDGHYLAYDYKKSAGRRVADIASGRDIQLAVYLTAIEHFLMKDGDELAGGGYYSLNPLASRRNNGLYRSEKHAYTRISDRCQSSLPDDEWTSVREAVGSIIWSYFDRIRTGDFRVLPSQGEKTCASCDYSSVCRFDRHRIGRKQVTIRPDSRIEASRVL